jgi:hypothetical protein
MHGTTYQLQPGRLQELALVKPLRKLDSGLNNATMDATMETTVSNYLLDKTHAIG